MFSYFAENSKTASTVTTGVTMDPVSSLEYCKRFAKQFIRRWWHGIDAKVLMCSPWIRCMRLVWKIGVISSKKSIRNVQWRWPMIRLPFMFGISIVVFKAYQLVRAQRTVCWQLNIVQRFSRLVVSSSDWVLCSNNFFFIGISTLGSVGGKTRISNIFFSLVSLTATS